MDDELAQVPEEFRAACGRPGSRVIVRHFPVTIGFRLTVHPGTLDVTVDVQLRPGSGGLGESHPQAPADPGVTVSRHRALLVLTARAR